MELDLDNQPISSKPADLAVNLSSAHPPEFRARKAINHLGVTGFMPFLMGWFEAATRSSNTLCQSKRIV